MSGSPKYSYAELEEQRIAAFLEQKRKREEEAARVRRAEEARILGLQTEELRRVVMAGLDAIRPISQREAHGELATRLPAGFDGMRAALDEAAVAIGQATDIRTLSIFAREIEKLSRTIQAVVAEA